MSSRPCVISVSFETQNRSGHTKFLFGIELSDPADGHCFRTIWICAIACHVDLGFKDRREQSLQRIRAVGNRDIAADDLDLVAELLTDATDHQR